MWKVVRKFIAECRDQKKGKTVFERIVEARTRQEAETRAEVNCKSSTDNPDNIKVTVT